MNPELDSYFTKGCGRCDLYQTPQCKVHTWTESLAALRHILHQTDLKEERKWSMPTYTIDGKNVLILSAFKNYCSLNFFKGSLLLDPDGLLEFAGPNAREAKLFKFRSLTEVESAEEAIFNFIQQAIAFEKEGRSIKEPKEAAEYPPELEAAFAADAGLEAAFKALTPGRQRGYLIHFNGAKQSATRSKRIEKWKPRILIGKGFHDR